jgi:Fic family protein
VTEVKKAKRALSILAYRQKTGAKASAELAEHVRAYNETRGRIVKAFGKGEKTIPEIATETGMESRDAFWHIMTLVRYGTLQPAEKKEDGYYTYRVREAGKK